jgi:hypothetical protein
LGVILNALRDAIDELVDTDPALLSDAATVLELERLLIRVDAVTSLAVAEFTETPQWGQGMHIDGAHGTVNWIISRAKLPPAVVRRQLRLGRAAQHLPVLSESWLGGKVGAAQVDAVERVRRFETEDSLQRDEPVLCDQAETLIYNHFCRAVHYWEQHADPNGAERGAESQRSRRDAFLSKSFDGMWLGKMTLEPVSGAIVSGELERIEQEMFEADWAKAKATLGYEPTTAHLCRQFSERRADALVEMATRSATCPRDGRRPDPLFTVLVDFPTLHGRLCELAQGAAVTPGSLVPWIDQAYIERAVFGLGARVEVSERARFFTGATRRALEVRDRGCTHPMCDESVDRCQADHIQSFSEGGLTVQENGRLLCGFHNRLAFSERKERPPPDG